MEITDEKFLECYCNWCSYVNWHTAQTLLAQMNKDTSIEPKKALFIKIFFEFMQAGEHLILLVDTIKKSKELDGFHHRFTESKTQGDGFRYLWDDLKEFEDDKYVLFEYLGTRLSEDEYSSEKKVNDGIFSGILTCLQNRYGTETSGNSNLMKSYNKIKHGFTLYTDIGSEDIYIIHRQSTNTNGVKGMKTEVITQRYDPEFAQGMCNHLEAMRNTFMNVCDLILKSGIKPS